MAESRGNTNAVGDTKPIRGLLAPSCGLFQIRTLPGRPTCEQLKDPKFNADYAYGLYLKKGFKPWSVYNNGQYRKYLK